MQVLSNREAAFTPPSSMWSPGQFLHAIEGGNTHLVSESLTFLHYQSMVAAV
jgi:hypothetical protein